MAEKTVAITGASGLVGSNLAHLLVNYGHKVIGVKRSTSKIDHLSHLPLVWVDANLNDKDALQNAFKSVDAIFHCAAKVSFWKGHDKEIWESNLEGTRNVLEAAKKVGVKRLIHCSSIDALGIPKRGQLSNEESKWNFDLLGFDYAYPRTKYESEQLVLKEVANGNLDAVIVNPSFMLGPYDSKPSSGRLTLEIARGKGIGYPGGSNNFVDVRDVCRGMIQAWQRGKSGQRYILGGENLSYGQIFTKIALGAGVAKPRFKIPNIALKGGGLVGDIISVATKQEFSINSQLAALSGVDHAFCSDKACRELGYKITPIETAIEDSLRWFRERGMLF